LREYLFIPKPNIKIKYYLLEKSEEEKIRKTSLNLIMVPNLKISTIKAIHYITLKDGGYDTFLLNFPEEVESILTDLASDIVSFDEFLNDIISRDIIPDPLTSWLYAMEPIFEALPNLLRTFSNLDIRCYGSKEGEADLMDISNELVHLILRTIITERVDHKLWRETITRSLRLTTEIVEGNSENILKKAGKNSIGIVDIGSFTLQRILEEEGMNTKVLYIEKPYYFTPLAVLERRMALGPVDDDELEELVLKHIEYVRDYIYRFRTRDRAHYEWALDMMTWPKLVIERRELDLLDNLLRDTQTDLQ
jgi:hypothetical protein